MLRSMVTHTCMQWGLWLCLDRLQVAVCLDLWSHTHSQLRAQMYAVGVMVMLRSSSYGHRCCYKYSLGSHCCGYENSEGNRCRCSKVKVGCVLAAMFMLPVALSVTVKDMYAVGVMVMLRSSSVTVKDIDTFRFGFGDRVKVLLLSHSGSRLESGLGLKLSSLLTHSCSVQSGLSQCQ